MKGSLAAVALVVLVAAAPAHAQSDFTITVPVNVSGVPASITMVSVTCDMMPEDYGVATPIAHIIRNQALTGGAYHGNVVVSGNALPGGDPSLARWYKCYAVFMGSVSGRMTTYFRNGSTPPVFPLVAGASLYLGNYDRWIRIPGVAH